jgi:hypothetical protein
MSKKHTVRAVGGELIHIDLNSHNSTGSSKNSMEGGTIELFNKPTRQNWQIMDDTQPVPSFTTTKKILKSKNILLNNLTTEDLIDLKKILAGLTDNQINDAKKVDKIKKATIERLQKSARAIKLLKPKDINVRGSTANKNKRLKEKGLIK